MWGLPPARETSAGIGSFHEIGIGITLESYVDDLFYDNPRGGYKINIRRNL